MDTSPVRFTGLFSGMDTAGMVQQLMRAESMRMDRFVRRRQMLAWRQEELRNTITMLDRFQTVNTAVGIGTGTITDPEVWNTIRATVSANGQLNPPGFNVSRPRADALVGVFNVTVNQVAQGDMLRSNQFQGTAQGATGQAVNMNASLRTFLGNNLQLYPPAGEFVRFRHELDDDGRGLYDLSHLTFDELDISEHIGIRRDANGVITEIRDGLNRVFLWDPAGGTAGTGAWVSGSDYLTLSDVEQIRDNTAWLGNLNLDDPTQFNTGFENRVVDRLVQGQFMGFEHRLDPDGRGLYDMSHLTFFVLDNSEYIGIRRDAGGFITEIRDGLNRVFWYDSTTSQWTSSDGLYTLTPNDLDLIRDYSGWHGDLDIDDPNQFNVGYERRVVDRVTFTEQANTTTISINGVNIPISLDMTIRRFIEDVNLYAAHTGARMSFDAIRGIFILESGNTGGSTAPGQHARIFTGNDGFGLLDHLGFADIRGGLVGGAVPDVPDSTVPGEVPGTGIYIGRQTAGFLLEAQDASVTIVNDAGLPLVLTNRTNNFTENITGLTGIDFTITQAAVTDPPRTFTIDTRVDVENTLEAIRTFVNNFNDLLRTLNAMHSTPRPRSQQGNFFDPLTDAEREGMSDREIERWEEQARTGILHRNDALQGLHGALRLAIFQDVRIGPPPHGRELGNLVNFSEFFNVGGGQMASREERNIGLIDVDWNRLRTALETEPARIEALFSRNLHQAIEDNTPPGGEAPSWASGTWSMQRNSGRAPFLGLGARIHDIIQNATHWDGSIRREAGYNIGHDVDTNPMSRQLQAYDSRLRDMQRWLIRRENHFFNMFARMEQAMANANAQMDSLWMMGGM